MNITMSTLSFPYNLVFWIVFGSNAVVDLNDMLNVVAEAYIPDLLKKMETLRPDVHRYLELKFRERKTCAEIRALMGIDAKGERSLADNAKYEFRKLTRRRWRAGSGFNEYLMSDKIACLKEENKRLETLLGEEGVTDVFVSETGLSPRVKHALTLGQSVRLSDLRKYSKEDFRKHFGVKVVEQISAVMEEHGLHLRA